MNTTSIQAQAKIGILIALTLAPVFADAATTPLAQFPPGNASRDPAPNVIVSVDDSGSMEGTVSGGRETATNPKKINQLKNSLTAAFATDKIPDGRIRLAWQSMWGCRGFPGARPFTGTNNGNGYFDGCVGNNTMLPFEGVHRTDFTGFINALKSWDVTPSHRMIQLAGQYMQTAAPWQSEPGVANSPMLECRKTYHIFLTDGDWNSQVDSREDVPDRDIGNEDGTTRTLPDGVQYQANGPQTQAYYDIYGAGQETLADLAFYYWATDLRDDMRNGPNEVPVDGSAVIKKGVQPVIRSHGTEQVGNTALQEYWNPKNDPATWQHITQYTIGFGTGAVSWAGRPVFDTSVDANGNRVDSNYSTVAGGYVDLVNGNNSEWQNVIAGNARTSELWHMALNGRGKFYPARSAESLTKAFNEILDNIKADTSRPLVSLAANATSLRNGALAYVAGYDASFWSGNISAKAIDTEGNIGTVDVWNSASLLDAAGFNVDNRLILTHDGSSPVTFFYPNLSTTQQALFNNVGGLAGTESVNYIRGNHDKEQTQTVASGLPPGPFRDRNKTENGTTVKTRQGDTVNSNIWFVGQPSSGYDEASYDAFRRISRTPMIYVGANDGMLHGFESSTGTERIAYIPKGVMSNLPKLTDVGYGDNTTGSAKTHLYFVDGSPFAGDIFDGSWKTYLAGTLGAGGKGYFVLDVTNPNAFSANNAANLVKVDNTFSATDAAADVGPNRDIGFMFGDASRDAIFSGRASQFAKLNSNTFALILGNGYNSSNGQAKLIVQTTPSSFIAVPTDGSTNNGLSTPTPIDLNGDGAVDVVYAGDIQGNLWKFDFTTGIPSSATKVYTTEGNKPITVAPTWIPHPKGGLMLGFGTGQNLTTADSSDFATVYRLYGVWDKGEITINSSGAVTLTNVAAFSGHGLLKSRAFTPGNSPNFRSITAQTAINFDTDRGWFINLPASSPSSERTLNNPTRLAGTFVFMPTQIPSSGSATVGETCETTTGERVGWLNVVDLLNGTQANKAIFDSNNDGVVDSNDTPYGGAKVGVDISFLKKNQEELTGFGLAGGASDVSKIELKLPPYTTVRSGWRQMP